jgi:GNAT superfamily N-acetyltransferase
LEIRHIEVEERDCVTSRHQVLADQHPELCKPFEAADEATSIDAGFPYFFYAVEGGRIASYFRSFPDTLFSGNKSFKWAWNAGLYTEVEFRGRGLAQQIVEYQLREFERRNIIWGGVFSSDAALRLYARMGFHIFDRAPRFCLIRNMKPFMRQRIKNGLVLSVLGGAFTSLYSASRIVPFGDLLLRRKYHVSPIGSLRFVSLLTQQPLVVAQRFYWGKDVRWFEARRRSRGIDNVFLVYRRGEQSPCAFLIVRERPIKQRLFMGCTGFTMMSVVEFGHLDTGSDTSEAIISGAILLFNNSSADILEFITSSPPIHAAARRRGLFRAGAGMTFKFMPPRGSAMEAHQSTISDWHMSHYCGDAFAFE